MSQDSVQQLLDAAQSAGLLRASQRESLELELAASAASTCRDVATQLVDRRILTAYQAEELLAGRGDQCVLAGRYHILDILGSGGMGTVYKALDTKLERAVAIKVMAPHYVSNSDAVARFQREAKALAKVSHAAIVQAHDAGEDRGRHFLVMEYVDGISLQRLVQDRGRIPPTFAADYIYQAAQGLQHAHERGLIHRDIKPGNLLLASGAIKILDLGLARFVQDQLGEGTLTREGMGMGTPDYMAPEQFVNARHADPRSDIYSLGCTLYQLLTGRVPFPGTSLAEKALAHEEQEPPPIEERCPDAPAGLAFVVQRMLAKRPADRLQSASEVAEALAPYIATSSASLPQIKATTSWHGSQLSVMLSRPPRRRRIRLLYGGAAAVVIAVIGLLLFTSSRFRPKDTSSDSDRDLAKTDSAPPQAAEPPDPNVLTVSQDATDGGQFRTIGEALEKAQPGQTIRVLDAATYAEAFTLKPRQHAGVTLEASKRATMLIPPGAPAGIAIQEVPQVTLRGFRLRGSPSFGVGVIGRCPGLVLDQLDIELARNSSCVAVTLEWLKIGDDEDPVIVQNCEFHKIGQMAVRLSGFADYQTPRLCRRVVLRNNRLWDCGAGINIVGAVQDVQVVGNSLWDVNLYGIQVENLMEGSQNVLIANNSLWHCNTGLRVWDNAVKGKNIQCRNNLILGAAGPDMLFLDSGGKQASYQGPGDVQALVKRWQIDHNWREAKQPTGTSTEDKAWMPPAETDKLLDPIPGLARDPNHSDFLRPAKDSPLASEGAGKNDPRLPMYVGAVPPEGVSPWDWNRTWRMPDDAQLLTVSKNPKDGGQYRTINDALKAAKPWATIRLLDGASYAEAVVLDDPAKHQGLFFDAPRQAAVELGAWTSKAFVINGVPHVRLRGLRFRGTGALLGFSNFIIVSGHAPGVVLDKLDLESPNKLLLGITLQNLTLAAGEPPVTVQDSSIRVKRDGIILAGPQLVQVPPCRGIVIRGNRISGPEARAILIQGAVADCHIVGNVMWQCGLAGVQFQDPPPHTQNVLLANNTIFKCGSALRVWDEAPFEPLVAGQVELRNNLFFDGEDGDVAYIQARGQEYTGDANTVLQNWRFDRNWRDLLGREASHIVPFAPTDRRLEKAEFISRDAASLDFMRPAADSPLATAGAGTEDPSLPTYAGAVPPKGAAAWDWDKTWRWRIRPTAAHQQPATPPAKPEKSKD